MPGEHSSSTATRSSPRPTRQACRSLAGPGTNSMADAIRTAVIGVGHLGRHHARILAALEGAALIAVVDTLPGRAAEVASAAGTRPLSDYRELLGAVDAVSIAAP